MTIAYQFTFTTRETYLAYKEEWKQRYAAQSKKQRELKHAIREEMRNENGAWKGQMNYAAGVQQVHALLSERAQSKEVAAIQWQHANQPA